MRLFAISGPIGELNLSKEQLFYAALEELHDLPDIVVGLRC